MHFFQAQTEASITQLSCVEILCTCVFQGTAPSKVEVRRFYRPEDISPALALESGFWDVFASEEKQAVDVDTLVGKCSVAPEASAGQFLLL